MESGEKWGSFPETYYSGIPFASPPTGALRWTPPQPHTPWEGVLNTTQMPPVCSQIGNYLFNLTYQSEDCLYLNAYVPSSTPPVGGFPVMVYSGGKTINFEYLNTCRCGSLVVVLCLEAYRSMMGHSLQITQMLFSL
jgi:hypothetical protein